MSNSLVAIEVAETVGDQHLSVFRQSKIITSLLSIVNEGWTTDGSKLTEKMASASRVQSAPCIHVDH